MGLYHGSAMFSPTFCAWIQSIFHYAHLSILINSCSKGYFSYSWGVRQGDPLSPLLFCIAEEFLNHSILKLIDDGSLSPMHSNSRVCCPLHLLYADDILIFYKALKSNIWIIINLFCGYWFIMTFVQHHLELATHRLHKFSHYGSSPIDIFSFWFLLQLWLVR